jgi:hypothetical protein
MVLKHHRLRPDFESRWEHLGTLPNWFLLDVEWWSQAWQVFKNYREARGALFSALLEQSSTSREWSYNLVSTLWDLDPLAYPDRWLSEACGGLDTPEMQEYFASSRLSTIYQCLDCEVALRTQLREQAFSKYVALESIRSVTGHWRVVPAEVVCELLCSDCAERRLRERQERILELKDMSYWTFLRSEEWMTISQHKLDRAKFLCAICQQTQKPMEVHHLHYIRRGDEYFDDLLVLCRHHHRYLEGLR